MMLPEFAILKRAEEYARLGSVVYTLFVRTKCVKLVWRFSEI